jgi:hypothetical protein
MIAAQHLPVIDDDLHDLRDAEANVKANPSSLATKGRGATCGMMVHLPSRAMVRHSMLESFTNSCRAGGLPLGEDEKAGAPKPLVERAAARCVAWRQRR